MKSKIWLILIPLIIIIAVASGGGYYIYNNILEVDTIYSGVSVDGINLSDMKKDAAYNYLKATKEGEQWNNAMNLILKI